MLNPLGPANAAGSTYVGTGVLNFEISTCVALPEGLFLVLSVSRGNIRLSAIKLGQMRWREKVRVT